MHVAEDERFAKMASTKKKAEASKLNFFKAGARGQAHAEHPSGAAKPSKADTPQPRSPPRAATREHRSPKAMNVDDGDSPVRRSARKRKTCRLSDDDEDCQVVSDAMERESPADPLSSDDEDAPLSPEPEEADPPSPQRDVGPAPAADESSAEAAAANAPWSPRAGGDAAPRRRRTIQTKRTYMDDNGYIGTHAHGEGFAGRAGRALMSQFASCSDRDS